MPVKIVFLTYLIYASLVLQSSHAGISEFFSEITNVENIKARIKNEIEKLELRTNVELVNSEIIDGVGLGIQYKYQLEPSYEAGFYTRADAWKFNSRLDPGVLVRATGLPISLRFEPGAEIYYVRQFKRQIDAVTAIPFTPERLPFTAQKAIKHLKPGDFVSIPTHLNLVLSAGMAKQFREVKLGASTYFILSGKFMVHLFRLADNKIRMKIIATRTRTSGGNLSAKFNFKFFGISLVKRSITKITALDLAKFSSDKEWGDLFMLDYVLDLEDSAAREAYNGILASTFTFKNLNIVNPFADNKNLEDQIVTDLTLIENISNKDIRKRSPRVKRIFRGKNQYKRDSNNFKVGLLLAKYQRRNIFIQNRVVSYDSEDNPTQYLFNNYSFYQGSDLFWGMFKKDRVFTVSTLLPIDQNDEVQGFSDLGISLDVRDKRFLYSEIRETMNHTRRSLSNEIYNTIDFGEFKDIKPWQKVDRARVFHQIFFHEAAVRYFLQYPTDRLGDDLYNFVQSIPMPGGAYNSPTPDPNTYYWINWLNNYQKSVDEFINVFKSACEIKIQANSNQFKAFEQKIMGLRSNVAFQTFGTGFMIHLLPAELKQKLVHVNLVWDGEGIQPLRFQYGDNPKSKMYKNLEYIESLLNNRGYDLRIIEEQKRFQILRSKMSRRVQRFQQLYQLRGQP